MRYLAVRTVRSVAGVLLLLVAIPLVLTAGGLWLVGRHRDGGGAYTAVTERVRTDGYALVAEDIDAVLRAGVPFARGGQTRLDLSAAGRGGPLFIGLGPERAVRRYLAGAQYRRVDRVRLARGPLPVDTTPVAGPASPGGLPFAQPFWVATATGLTRDGRVEDPLTWNPAAVRGEHLALVVMNADASAGVDVRLAAAVTPGWLVPTTWGLTVFGGTLLLLGAVLLAWPAPGPRIVYVTEPERIARLLAEGFADAAPGDAAPAPAVSVPENTAEPTGEPAAAGTRGEGRTGTTRVSRCTAAGATTGTGGRAEPSGWAVLLASTRPPATPRLLWPPRRPDRATSSPVPAVAGRQLAAVEAGPAAARRSSAEPAAQPAPEPDAERAGELDAELIVEVVDDAPADTLTVPRR